MGLPLFVLPVETEPVSKSSEDATAHARSSIRRQRTIRRPVRDRSDERRRDLEVEVLGAVERRELEMAAATRARVANRIEERRRLLSGGDWAVAQAPRSEGGRAQIVDGPVREPISPPVVSSDLPRMPPVPESGDFQSNRDRQTRSRHVRRGWIVGPPPLEDRASTADRQPYVERMGPTRSPSMPSLTPNFSPARRYTLEDPWTREPEAPATTSSGPSSSERFSFDSYVRPSHDPPAMSSWQVPTDPARRDIPYLRRMGRRSIVDFEIRQRRLRQARLDGLGDRDRSLSPEGDAVWETLLTTLTPDPQPPSVGSSFASTVVATSTSSNTESMATSRTTPDSTDAMHPAADTACEVADEESLEISDTDEEDDGSWEAYIELRGRRDELRNQRDEVYRSYAEAVESRALDGDIGSMQRLVRRLASNASIPDSWWAEVGLSRIIPHEAIQLRS